jgi:hypothetical protein
MTTDVAPRNSSYVCIAQVNTNTVIRISNTPIQSTWLVLFVSCYNTRQVREQTHILIFLRSRRQQRVLNVSLWYLDIPKKGQ